MKTATITILTYQQWAKYIKQQNKILAKKRKEVLLWVTVKEDAQSVIKEVTSLKAAEPIVEVSGCKVKGREG